jgi:hypothetical protein
MPGVDFVFIDDGCRPYRIKTWGERPWLFYWHVDHHWVSLRPLRPFEVASMLERALPPEHAKIYKDSRDA